MNDIVDGFINGIEVQYSADIPEFGIQIGPAVIRHLILLWTGDHPGQCEVAKVKRTGKKACHKWTSKSMEESLPHMKAADEEVGAAWSRISRDSGFTGVSIFLFHMTFMDLMCYMTLLLI